MSRWFIRLGLIILGVVAFPRVSPAPLRFVPGEGWIYEAVGSEGKWMRTRAKDQYDVAKEAMDKSDYNTAAKAARRVVRVWPLSDSAPQAQYLLGRCYEAEGSDEKAFSAYQDLVTKYPKVENYNEVLERQYEIATRYLGGEWFRLWGLIPFFPSMEKTAVMYSKIVTNGPYSEVGPKAQLGVGAAREKKKDYASAVRAYEAAADRYSANEPVAAESLFRAGLAYQKQARRAEYDQSTAGQAISTFTYFKTLHPEDTRVPEAEKLMASLKTEQARGNFEIARFYEGRQRWEAARIYYNEVVALDPKSSYADTARQRIEALNQRLGSPNREAALPLAAPGGQPPERQAPPEGQPGTNVPAPVPLPSPMPAEAAHPAQPPPETNPAGKPPDAGGYRLGPTGGRVAGANSIQILPFINRTLEPRLTEAITTALRRNFQQDGTYRLRTDGEADLVVSGSITEYKRNELTLAKSDLLSVHDYQVLITAQVKVVERATGKVILEKPFTGWTIMRLGNDLPSLERQTVPELAEDLARNITTTITEGKW